MNTKNILWSLLAMILLVFTSCSKEDDTPDVSAGFTASKTTAAVGEEIQFTNNSANATSFTWSFGDGTTSTEKSPKKVYNASDVFEVSLSATGAGGTTISKASITIVPAVGFNVENEGDLQASTPVKFTNTTQGATAYEWDFGDGGKSTEANPEFTYSKAGTYNVTLKATGKGGSATLSKSITVKEGVVARDLYYIEYGANKIFKLNLASGATPIEVLDITGKAGAGIAYDSENDKIYFSDFEDTDNGKIWVVNLDGTGLKEIVSGITDPYNISINFEEDKIYWADDDGNISRANLDGSALERSFIHIDDGQMRGLAFDVVNKKIYFYEVNNEDLYVADANGSNIKKIVSGVYGYGIFADAVNGKLYFDERNSSEIKVANLDGTGITTFATTAKTRIHGMDLDYQANKFYWSDRDAKQINRANLDGTNVENILSDLDSPRGIFIK